MSHTMKTFSLCAMCAAVAVGVSALPDEPAPAPKTAPPPATANDKLPGRPVSPTSEKPVLRSVEVSPGAVPLNKEQTVFLDKPRGKLLLKTRVALREGSLELFCCLKQTKEHESVLSLESRAQVVHAGLLALGAHSGEPARFDPKYTPPTGDRIDIFVNWYDERGKAHRAPAQSWVRRVTRRTFIEKLAKLPPEVHLAEGADLRYDAELGELYWFGAMSAEQNRKLRGLSSDKAFQRAIDALYESSRVQPMTAVWVFTGSGFFTDDETGKKYYLAEDGDLICVANFANATLDVALESSAGNDGLLFEAYTERIPPRGTPVLVELIPVQAPPPAK